MARPRLEYLEVRKIREQFRKEESDSHDKAILQLSAAAIGVSLIVLDKLAMPKPVHLWMIIVSWIVLTLGLISTVVSYYVSQNVLGKEIQNLDREQAGFDSLPTRRTFSLCGKPYTLKAGHLNKTSGVALFVGIFFILAFSICNVMQRASDAKIPTAVTTVKGEVSMPDSKSPPPPPPPPEQSTPVQAEHSFINERDHAPIDAFDSSGPPPPPVTPSPPPPPPENPPKQ